MYVITDDSDDLAEYAQVKEVYPQHQQQMLDGTAGANDPQGIMYPYPHDATTPNKANKLRHRRDANKSMYTTHFFQSRNLLLIR